MTRKRFRKLMLASWVPVRNELMKRAEKSNPEERAAMQRWLRNVMRSFRDRDVVKGTNWERDELGSLVNYAYAWGGEHYFLHSFHNVLVICKAHEANPYLVELMKEVKQNGK